MTQVEDYNICLTIAMARDGNYTPMPLIRETCHCTGKHFKARGEINRDSKQIKVNMEDYAKFLEINKHYFTQSSAINLT